MNRSLQLYNEYSLKWISSNWKCWKNAKCLEELLDSIFDTWLFYLPCPRFKSLKPERESTLDDVNNCLRLLCQISNIKYTKCFNFSDACSQIDLHFEGIKLLKHDDSKVVAALVGLFLENAPLACKIKLSAGLNPDFLQKACSLLHIEEDPYNDTTWYKYLQSKIFPSGILEDYVQYENLTYVPLDYFQNVLNISEEDLQKIEATLSKCHHETRISMESLKEICYVSNTKYDVDNEYKITFKTIQ